MTAADSATSPLPRLTRSDAYLLAAATESGGRPVDLQGLVHDFDWLNRDIPTFDALSYGIPRLVAHGFLHVTLDDRARFRFAATPSARGLRRQIKARTLGDVVDGMTRLVGAKRWPEPEMEEDRSLGRLSGLTSTDVDVAVDQHQRWGERWSKPLMALSRVVMWWVNRRVR